MRRHPECLLLCQLPLTLLATTAPSFCLHSLKQNKLGPKGGAALAEGLKGNSSLQILKYVARCPRTDPQVFAFVSTR